MKTMNKRVAAAFLSLTMGASLAGCSNSSAPASAPAATDAPAAAATSDAGGKTVGIAMPTKSLERWNRDGEYLKKEFEAAGHSAAYHFGNKDVFICHGYSVRMHGASILVQRDITWDADGWPKL